MCLVLFFIARWAPGLRGESVSILQGNLINRSNITCFSILIGIIIHIIIEIALLTPNLKRKKTQPLVHFSYEAKLSFVKFTSFYKIHYELIIHLALSETKYYIAKP